MKLGLHLNDFSWPVPANQFGPTIEAIGQIAERAGFSAIAVMDHVWQHPIMGGPEKPVLECYSTLTYIAAHTKRVKLLALATPASYRAPAILAKSVTTLDVLSGGRAMLGMGAGDYEDEAHGLGIPFPSASERYELLEDAIQVCLRMWRGDRGDERPFAGTHVRLERPLNLPQSLSRPHPPILIAGSGEQRTLRLVAQYGDACNIRPGPEIPRKLEILRRHCEAVGRNYDEIEQTCPYLFDPGPNGTKVAGLVNQLRDLAAMGIQTVFGRVVGDHELTPIELMGQEVIPAIADF